MGNLTLRERVLGFIAHIGWRIFILFEYGGNENRYHDTYLSGIGIDALNAWIKEWGKEEEMEEPNNA